LQLSILLPEIRIVDYDFIFSMKGPSASFVDDKI
jgi:hypothetical protein